ncbi:MAG: SAM-dependent methyltransferase [Candidatus Cloacimonetes bacterium]|nr:SAM-dependent methyltransferase [Candidatus Cloacimonadota bacterium]
MAENRFEIREIGKIIIDDRQVMIELGEKYREGLDGLAGFSHIQVLWWCHHNDTEKYRQSIECHTPYKNAPEILGTFATRSPFRPNPIGLTAAAVKSIDVQKGRIYLYYIDAENESPLIDIKPYHPSTDRIRDVKVPSWCEHWPKWQEDSEFFAWEDEFDF